MEWRTIPGIPGYVINEDGVLFSPWGRKCIRVGPLNNQYNIKFQDGTRSKLTVEALLKKAKRGQVVAPPVEEEDDENVRVYTPKKRKCHDCGAPTWDYRCQECQSKWRTKYDVPQNSDGNAFDILYGWQESRGGKHAHHD